ncbi:MAG: murein L,D-transpeptidase family protein [Acidobacteriota bacterium]
MNYRKKVNLINLKEKPGFLIFFILLILIQDTFLSGITIPESSRSKKVIKKLTPKLEKDFKNKGLTLGNPVFLRIFKDKKELEVWVKKGDKYKLFKKYWICYFSGGIVTKTKEGDSKSPEGFYFVRPGQLNPWSSYHLSFNIGYPNRYDRAHGYTGGEIMVHGNCVSIGCYAMTDKRIEEIFTIIHKAYENGQPFFRIHIFPFKMIDNNLAKYKNTKWNSFRRNLKEGYEYFEKHKVPPDVSVRNKKYIFD